MDETSPSGKPPDASTVESEIDWAEVLNLVRRTVGVHLRRSELHETDDLADEALVRVLRAVRLQPPRNIEALATRIAQRTCADYIRRRRRQAALHQALLSEAGHDSSSLARPGDDDLDRLRFVTLEFFRADEGTPCGELARAFFSEINWKDWAAGVGRSHDAVRQEWSRCVKKLQTAARRRGPLFEWMKSDEDDRE